MYQNSVAFDILLLFYTTNFQLIPLSLVRFCTHDTLLFFGIYRERERECVCNVPHHLISCTYDSYMRGGWGLWNQFQWNVLLHIKGVLNVHRTQLRGAHDDVQSTRYLRNAAADSMRSCWDLDMNSCVLQTPNWLLIGCIVTYVITLRKWLPRLCSFKKLS